MAHAAKYASAAVGHLAAHYERRKDGKGEYVKFGNQDIDLQRTHLNYNLAPQRKIGQREFIHQRLSEVPHAKRKDLIVMCDWVVTLPKEIKSMNDRELPPAADVSKIFFDRTYRFLANRYGEENTVSSYVHRDEITDHMHYSFVPVIEDKKKGGWKISAKDLISRKELRAFHTELERYLDSFGDIHFGVINEATKEGNRTVAELKQAANIEKTAETERELAQVDRQLSEVKAELQPLLRLQADVAEPAKKGVALPGMVLISAKAHAVMKQQAMAYRANRDEIESLRARETEVKWKEENIEWRLGKLEKKEAEVDNQLREAKAERRHQAKLNDDYDALERRFQRSEGENRSLRGEIAALKGNIDDMRADHAAEIAQLTTQHNQRLLDLRRAYERELKKLQQKKKERDISD